LALYRPSGGPLSLEPLAPFSCRPGQSAAKPPGALRGKVLWSASSWPLRLAAALPPPLLLLPSCLVGRRLFSPGPGLRSGGVYGKVPRVGFLTTFASSDIPLWREGFRQGLRDLGYREGQNIIIEYRYADGRPDRLLALASELVGLKIDVIAVETTPATLALKQATGTIPDRDDNRLGSHKIRPRSQSRSAPGKRHRNESPAPRPERQAAPAHPRNRPDARAGRHSLELDQSCNFGSIRGILPDALHSDLFNASSAARCVARFECRCELLKKVAPKASRLVVRATGRQMAAEASEALTRTPLLVSDRSRTVQLARSLAEKAESVDLH
jgi:ABC transporter substrate binding protein